MTCRKDFLSYGLSFSSWLSPPPYWPVKYNPKARTSIVPTDNFHRFVKEFVLLPYGVAFGKLENSYVMILVPPGYLFRMHSGTLTSTPKIMGFDSGHWMITKDDILHGLKHLVSTALVPKI